jgi:hypothetical protein
MSALYSNPSNVFIVSHSGLPGSYQEHFSFERERAAPSLLGFQGVVPACLRAQAMSALIH